MLDRQEEDLENQINQSSPGVGVPTPAVALAAISIPTRGACLCIFSYWYVKSVDASLVTPALKVELLHDIDSAETALNQRVSHATAIIFTLHLVNAFVIGCALLARQAYQMTNKGSDSENSTFSIAMMTLIAFIPLLNTMISAISKQVNSNASSMRALAEESRKHLNTSPSYAALSTNSPRMNSPR